MKELIICEKPSLAKNVCAGLQLNKEHFINKADYYESRNYIVTAVFGHLFTLDDIDDYTGTKNKWADVKLPFIPMDFKFHLKRDHKTSKVDKGIKNRFELIKRLVHDDNISNVIHCGDADREGEIIIRIVLTEAGNTKPVKRMWLPEQTEQTIAKAIHECKNDLEYEPLANEGMARLYVDWLYGINLTRYASVKSNKLLRVGRVITPIVNIIYERDMQIKNFVSKPYYQLHSSQETKGHVIDLLVNTKFDEKADIEMLQLQKSLNSSKTIVKNIEKKEKVVASPKLFAQSDLQNYLSKACAYAPSETLAISQQLYEKGFITYPRTNSNYLGVKEGERISILIESIKNKYNLNVCMKSHKRIFDDHKIESHSALTPTFKFPAKEELSEKELNVYRAIFNRFCAVFCEEERRVMETIVELLNGKTVFKLKGVVPLSIGWTKFEAKSIDTEKKSLPNLKIEEEVKTQFNIISKKTTPKKHWTVETLNNYLKNPFKKEADSEEDEYKNIFDGLEVGTEATRAGIIENAIKSNYINLKKSTYTITAEGIYLIETLNKLNVNLQTNTTASLGKKLKSITKNEVSIESLVTEVSDYLSDVIDDEVQVKQFERTQVSLGKCPVCGSDVTENNKSYTCVERSCKFTIWKETNFITKIGKKKLTQAMIKSLLAHGKVKVKGLQSKKGSKYDAVIYLEITDKYVNLKPSFEEVD
ncbi:MULTISPECIES: type IA DNA topoisomerase [unclassified Breznakia]|uniref:type IA DNA topoisomerase n=1 Tax=unclassified Breznakia TaxID=2623764 RepID=UPI002475BE2E|nr:MULTISPECIES: type IA DNA topoisomerase [unclassified Breznakia]MDH6367407.1 DNA topoisomerase-3 [Breznakia sp. PH1-1]MDH6403939.1 DNA topoisomerase-3 [Breznakia sp. PF1-11]MDH6411648.1 DNA topoisomerase-3 [Breznakia sp. PFB1-11]MDH6414574.1 DNA topoisomerase-3 [Breznakia sp. PFB1-14]MDH6418680.1 DNA topoisomerase-3 [Breznakia sp. PFB1-12]